MALAASAGACGSLHSGGRSHILGSAKSSLDYRDADDESVAYLGRPAAGPERAAIIATVKRYYAAAAAADGAIACRLMSSGLAQSVAQYYETNLGPHYTGPRTCPAVASKIFEGKHEQLAGALAVTDIRITAGEAYVIIGSPTRPAAYLTMRRMQDGWAADILMAIPLP